MHMRKVSVAGSLIIFGRRADEVELTGRKDMNTG